MSVTSGGPGGPPALTNDVEMKDNNSKNEKSTSKENNSKTNANNPEKSEINYLYQDIDDGPYYIFMESVDTNKAGIARMHPMSLGSILKKQFPNIEILSLTKNGINRIKVQVSSREKANTIIKADELKNLKVKAYIPRFVLFRQGIVRNVDTSLTEDELLEEITPIYNRSVKVTNVRRFNRRVQDTDGNIEYVPTGTIQVTFRGQSLPTHVSIYYVRCDVEKYVPKVLQCTKCLRYGHTDRLCKSTLRCSLCAENHPDNQCSTAAENRKCLHCKGPHSARVNFKNNVCPELDKQKMIKNLMIDENVTFYEAKTKLSSNYASVLSSLKDPIASSTDVNTHPTLKPKRPIRRLSIRQEILSPLTPARDRKRQRLQESPKQQKLTQDCQKILKEHRYDQNQFPNGVCLNSNSKNESTTKTNSVQFENVDKLSSFICTIVKNSGDLVGKNKQISPHDLTVVIQKELSNSSYKSKYEENTTDLISSSEDD